MLRNVLSCSRRSSSIAHANSKLEILQHRNDFFNLGAFAYCTSCPTETYLNHNLRERPTTHRIAQPRRSKATMAFSTPRDLYPPIEPTETGFLSVSGGHNIYWEVSGNPTGKPVVFLHGGPGSGTTPKMRQFFDPAVYKIILFDQRGAGKSTPFADLSNNTVWDLVSDMEVVRTHLNVDKWQVFGGSWGSTLALAYAETHPDRCTELVLRGIFTLRDKELKWFYQEGASYIFPDAWEHYVAPIPEEERADFIAAYHKRLNSEDEEVKMLREYLQAACKAWSIWEGTTSKLFPDPDFIKTFAGDHFALSFARIENHYFTNWKHWVHPEDKLIADVGKIRHIPCVIVQGRYDLVCPAYTAHDLKKAWPEADFVVVPDAGHSAYEPGIQAALLAATDRFRA